MFERSRSRKAFDNCQVRAAVNRNALRSVCAMVCAKYPSGFEASSRELGTDISRETLAITLGCLACPYSKTKLQTGESAVEAIRRVSSQSSIDELNRLYQEPSAPEN